MPASLDIVIVNWNSGNQLRSCLESVVPANGECFHLERVVIVDNDSHDDSLNGIENFQLPVHIIRNSENRGFAAACNQGASKSSASYLLFLNPDTILNGNSITDSIAFMENQSHARIGILGIQLVDEHDNVSRTCALFPTARSFAAKMLGLDKVLPGLCPSYLMTEWDHGTSRFVDHVIGAFYLVRRSLFGSLNGFDESYFVYLEDLDFSLRAHNAGWKSYYLADVKAYHKGGGVSEQAKAARLYYSRQSRIVFAWKHMSLLSSTLIILGMLFIEPLIRLSSSIIKRDIQLTKDTVIGYALLWKALPHMIKLRKQYYSQ